MKQPQVEESLLDFDTLDNSKLPTGWEVESLADGSLRVMPPGHGQRTFMDDLTLVIACIAALLFLMAIASGLVSGKWVFEGLRLDWQLLPFAPVVLLLIYSAFNGGHEWIASHNRLEFRWAGKAPNFRKSRSYTKGRFKLSRYSDDGSGYWQLDFECPNGWMNQGQISQSSQFEEVHYLGEILSAKTGWPLKLPSKINGKIACDSGSTNGIGNAYSLRPTTPCRNNSTSILQGFGALTRGGLAGHP